MPDKYWEYLRLNDTDRSKVHFIPTAPNGDKLGGVSVSEKATWNGKYSKPSGGIPDTDLSSDVQTSLDKADSAVQSVKTLNGNTMAGTGNVTIMGGDLVEDGSDTYGLDFLPGNAASIDATLTQNGMAADAKVTGDALASRIRFDASQTLTTVQKIMSRSNIDADGGKYELLKTITTTESIRQIILDTTDPDFCNCSNVLVFVDAEIATTNGGVTLIAHYNGESTGIYASMSNVFATAGKRYCIAGFISDHGVWIPFRTSTANSDGAGCTINTQVYAAGIKTTATYPYIDKLQFWAGDGIPVGTKFYIYGVRA